MMRQGGKRRLASAVLAAAGVFAAFPAPALPRAEKGDAGAAAGMDWVRSPYRHFQEARTLPGAHAVLFDEADDPALRAALADELSRLDEELYRRQGWRPPFAGEGVLRIYVARAESGGVRTTVSRPTEDGRPGPAVLLDATGLSTPAIVREVGRLVARATLAGYATDDPFLAPALAEFLSAPAAEGPGEQTWVALAAPELDFRARPAALGRYWVAEVARSAGGSAILREAWERAADLGEPPTAVLLRAITEETGQTEEAVLLRAAARLYAALEPEASPSRLRLLDVESGAIDASAPASLAARHRSFQPESDETLRVVWPLDGGAGAAVVRYRDAQLPADVVFFSAGERRSIPLSGVARVDWVVAGASVGGRGVAAPVYADLASSVPYSGLEARAAAGADGARLIWTTASHDGLWGWAVFREEVLQDGRVARRGPEIVPSAQSSTRSFRYEFVDTGAVAGTYYRYTVWAVTDEGLLARAFAATLKAGE